LPDSSCSARRLVTKNEKCGSVVGSASGPVGASIVAIGASIVPGGASTKPPSSVTSGASTAPSPSPPPQAAIVRIAITESLRIEASLGVGRDSRIGVVRKS
jgi:hypothetical protein